MKQKSSFFKALGIMLLSVLFATQANAQNLTVTGTVTDNLAYIIHSGFISGYQNRYGDNLKPPTNVYHRMTA